MNRCLVLSLLCSAALSYAQETEEQKAACDSMVNMIEAFKVMIPKERVKMYSKMAGEWYDVLTQTERSEVPGLSRIYLEGREVQGCYERFLEGVADQVDYGHSREEIAVDVYEKIKETFVTALSQKDNLSVECLKRIQEAFAKED